MKVGYIQFKPEFGRVESNIEKASKIISEIDAELVVLPELCFSGYTFISKDEVVSMAESVEDGSILKRMRDLAVKFKKGIIYGFPENSDGKYFNSSAFVRPDGKVNVYRKLHLYYYEKEWFTPGDKQLEIINFRGCKIGMMICFDWFFPEVTRSLALMGAHLICHPVNLVMSSCPNSMITRCLENSVFAITANRTGVEKRGEFDHLFTGTSQIVSNRGDIIKRASADKEEPGVADINFRDSEDKEVNIKNDLWKDRRPEFYRMGKHGQEQT